MPPKTLSRSEFQSKRKLDNHKHESPEPKIELDLTPNRLKSHKFHLISLSEFLKKLKTIQPKRFPKLSGRLPSDDRLVDAHCVQLAELAEEWQLISLSNE